MKEKLIEMYLDWWSGTYTEEELAYEYKLDTEDIDTLLTLGSKYYTGN